MLREGSGRVQSSHALQEPPYVFSNPEALQTPSCRVFMEVLLYRPAD